MPAAHNTFVLERTFAKPPSAVFRAFSDPSKLRRWFADGDKHEIVAFSSDFRVGGAQDLVYRLGDRSPFPGVEIVNNGQYVDIVADARIVTTSAMTFGGRRISASLITIELAATAAGTALTCTHQGAFFEGSDGPVIREAGWQKLLDKISDAL